MQHPEPEGHRGPNPDPAEALLRLRPPEPAAPLLGHEIGSYRLVRVLGQGGMGVVYEAVHQRIGRRAAIKMLVPRYSRDQAMVQRFFTEARAVNLVRHPGLVSVYELGCLPDGTAYIVMEHLHGETLRARIAAGGPRPPLEVLRLGRQIASALQAAHRRGVVHRDLKPDNLMIVADPDVPGGERAKVLDFGLAQVADEGGGHKTRTGIVMGTPRYMSPEQCRGVRPITDRADVYALGLNLYHMLAGHAPFEAEAMGDLLVMQIRQAPPPLRERAPGTPAALTALIHEMLDKAPTRRPAMAQVEAALRAIEEALPSLLRPGRVAVPLAPPAFGPPRPPDSASLRAALPRLPSLSSLPSRTAVALRAPEASRALDGASGARRGRALLTLCLAALVASGAWMGSAAGAARWARRLVQGPAAPAQRADAALWLLDAERALQARAWGEALRRAERVLALPQLPPELRAEAQGSRDRALREERAAPSFERFQGALDGRRYDEALAAFRELPPESVYFALAQPAYSRTLQLVSATHLQRARAARAAGRCADLQAEIAEVLLVDPRSGPALRLRAARCAPRPADEAD